MMTRRNDRTAPLALLVGVFVLGCNLGVLVGAAVFIDTRHDLGVPVWQVVLAGTPVAVIAAGFTAWGAARFARVLRLLRADAARRITEPPGTVQETDPRTSVPEWAGSELFELARALDALQLRVRMTDEVAERHRRTAETASAGMFELLSGLVAAEEGARGQLAAELHDTVAQSLMTARALLADGMHDARRRSLIGELVGEAEEQVRAVMARTRPPALRDGDLARAVAALRDDLWQRYGVEVTVGWPTDAYPVPLATAVTVYRFFQEALLNVVKHADVDAATADLQVEHEWVIATVADAGPGFDPEGVRSDGGRHVGLGLLRDRARLLGGALEISSWPAEGTVLTLRLPRGAGAAPGLLPMPRAAAASMPSSAGATATKA